MSICELKKERGAFLAAKEITAGEARQRLALQIFCNIDLDQLPGKDEASRVHMCRRLIRLIERERLKGTSGHWSYDLNRHIGLKQALDRLQGQAKPKMAI
ncbi:cob(I)alamin adenosyltransferase [Phyllobacterium ifriqiyense]|uniref:Cob(I)alamin adenosyltransferase n=1 Tax=Phyllobacterium ifriqiyense TaxID=314238 RepID=A0ABU0SCM5_9HYPH|nr:cytoplasmic protein [Phyllobacterium ifriqiyense]MDQ0998514.1 cob(I)alamin adenosyltransferase [Phyllobacterium ifriqiyense]